MCRQVDLPRRMPLPERWIRPVEQRESGLVAMITGNAVSPETRDELAALGVAVYYKPLTATQIQQVVDALVGSTSGGAA